MLGLDPLTRRTLVVVVVHVALRSAVVRCVVWYGETLAMMLLLTVSPYGRPLARDNEARGIVPMVAIDPDVSGTGAKMPPRLGVTPAVGTARAGT